MSNLTRVTVVFGGRSVEHEISIITALEVLEALDARRYQAVPVYIAQNGMWYIGPALADRSFYRRLPGALSEVRKVALLPMPNMGELTILDEPLTVRQRLTSQQVWQTIPVDIFFPALHGSFGEDGCIQGLFEMANVAYVGSDVVSSALCMNKWLCKGLLRAHGIPVLPGAKVEREPWRHDPVAAREAVFTTEGLEDFPLFVKPCSLGSSIGISTVGDVNALDAALADAFQFDSAVIVEPQVQVISEINVSVLQGKAVRASVVERPFSKSGILSYKDKYLSGNKGPERGNRTLGMASLPRRVDPEEIPAAMKARVQDLAVQAFQIIGCSGVARIDFILDQNSDELFLNEINTLPGSMAYYLWEHSTPPLTYTAILSEIIESALRSKVSKDSNLRNTAFRVLFQ